MRARAGLSAPRRATRGILLVMRIAQPSRIAVGAVSFALGATGAYLVQRLVDHALGATFDPTSVLEEPRVAFYWRAATAAWWGGLFAIAAYALCSPARGADPSRALLALALASVPLGLLHVTLSWLFP